MVQLLLRLDKLWSWVSACCLCSGRTTWYMKPHSVCTTLIHFPFLNKNTSPFLVSSLTTREQQVPRTRSKYFRGGPNIWTRGSVHFVTVLLINGRLTSTVKAIGYSKQHSKNTAVSTLNVQHR